ncbi:hypothetical protein [Chitinilyticum piscinae]|uniref:Uncharacterized protein n=1 Tax=Chitinilyticum piscinae TaxID=2866724 RepID=A0A8J7G2J3_9NEIS|nr:hypothetical protein [Chitinilyticum piscinae]MBE9610835.1 hypothetical protein [Chitinilyticum piscinae]
MRQIISLTRQQSMRHYLEQVWALLEDAYRDVAGGLHFADHAALLDESARWQLALCDGRVLAVTVFKAKKGLKLIAMAAACELAGARDALCEMLRRALRQAWMELSGRAESFVMKYCDGHRFLIHGSLIPQLLDKPIEATAADGYHYVREILQQRKTKIAVGTFRA